jgi:hypothetical protein
MEWTRVEGRRGMSPPPPSRLLALLPSPSH